MGKRRIKFSARRLVISVACFAIAAWVWRFVWSQRIWPGYTIGEVQHYEAIAHFLVPALIGGGVGAAFSHFWACSAVAGVAGFLATRHQPSGPPGYVYTGADDSTGLLLLGIGLAIWIAVLLTIEHDNWRSELAAYFASADWIGLIIAILVLAYLAALLLPSIQTATAGDLPAIHLSHQFPISD